MVRRRLTAGATAQSPTRCYHWASSSIPLAKSNCYRPEITGPRRLLIEPRYRCPRTGTLLHLLGTVFTVQVAESPTTNARNLLPTPIRFIFRQSESRISHQKVGNTELCCRKNNATFRINNLNIRLFQS